MSLLVFNSSYCCLLLWHLVLCPCFKAMSLLGIILTGPLKGLKFPNEVSASKQALTLTSHNLSIKHSSDNSVPFLQKLHPVPIIWLS